MKLLSFIYYITIQKCKHFLYILKIIISYNIKYNCSSIWINIFNDNLHIPEHTRSLSGSLLGYKTIP